MEKQISIIIPTYNMEAYIGKCLDSLLIPEFGAVEVLVVNDGSKDRSSEIAHSYADRYPGSIRVIDKPNGNYGSCINAALPLATGRYIKVLDADDTFDTAAFSRFVRLLPQISTDLILTSYCVVNESNEVTSNRSSTVFSFKLDKPTEIVEGKTNLLPCFISMHRISYNRVIFQRFNYSQIEGVSYSDAQWSIQPLSFCRSVYNTDLYLYRYLVGRAGQTVDPKVFQRSIPQSFQVLGRLVDDILKLSTTACNITFYKYQVVRLHRLNYLKAINTRDVNIMRILKEHDTALKKIGIALYDEVGNLGHENLDRFKFIKYLRDNNYICPFKIPKTTRVLMALNSVLGKLLKK